LVPVITISLSYPPAVGEKLVMVGAACHVKPAHVAVPPGLVIDTTPEEPLPTTAVMYEPARVLNDAAGVPPKLTDVTLVRFEPNMYTVEPLPAIAGLTLPIVGGAFQVKVVVLITLPPGVLMAITPLAPDAAGVA